MFRKTHKRIIPARRIPVLFAALALAALVFAGCGSGSGGGGGTGGLGEPDTTDQMWEETVTGETIDVFVFDGRAFTVKGVYEVDTYISDDLQDGAFYRLVADVTYLNGGVAGYVNFPEFKDVSSCEEITADELNIPTIEETIYGLVRVGDWADGDIILNESGMTALWKEGAWIWIYDQMIKLEDGTLAFCRDGVTEEEVAAGREAGVLSCEDYFILPQEH